MELNNTFYQQPSATKVAAWLAATPPTFRFSVKAQRGGSFRAFGGAPEPGLPWLTEPYRAFGERLGTVLFRVPDGVQRDDAKLAAFLAAWPRDLPLTLEFQDPSLARRRDVRRARRRRRRPVRDGAARRAGATDPAPDRPVPLPAAAPPRLRRRPSSRPGPTGWSRSWRPATTPSCSSATTRSGAGAELALELAGRGRGRAAPVVRRRQAREPSAGPNATSSTRRSVDVVEPVRDARRDEDHRAGHDLAHLAPRP